MGIRIDPSNCRGFVYTHVEYPSVMVLSDYEVGEGFTLDLIEEFPCPRCDKTLRVPKDHSGKIMCPNCEWKFQYPLPQGSNPLLPSWLNDPDHIVNKVAWKLWDIELKIIGILIIVGILLNILFAISK